MQDSFLINSITIIPPSDKDKSESAQVNVTFTFSFGQKDVQVNHPLAATDPKTGKVNLTENLVTQVVDDIRIYTQTLTFDKTDEATILAEVKKYAIEYKAAIVAGNPATSHPLVGKSQTL